MTDWDEDGMTLIEIVVSIAILGLAVAAVMGGMMTSILSADVHRKQATGETVVRAYAELAKEYARLNYAPCPAGNTYNVGFSASAPAGYTAEPVLVEYRAASGAWVPSCPGGTDLVQRLTVVLRSNDARSNESVQFVVRKP